MTSEMTGLVTCRNLSQRHINQQEDRAKAETLDAPVNAVN